MKIKSSACRRSIFYIGVIFFVLSLVFSAKLPYAGGFFLMGVILMCCYPVNDIKRNKL